MILLYTGAQTNNTPQIISSNSLGGRVSSSPVPNGRLSNIFSSISKSDVVGNKAVIRMIALKNTSGATVNNVKVYSDVADSHIKLKLAAVSSALVDNAPMFESVLDGSSLPYQASLDYHEGVGNAINVGSIPANTVIGIWILREIDLTKFPEFTSDLSGAALAQIIEDSQAIDQDDVHLIISWD